MDEIEVLARVLPDLGVLLGDLVDFGNVAAAYAVADARFAFLYCIALFRLWEKPVALEG